MSAKIALFNDTSVSRHYGCAAAVDSLLSLLAAPGAELIHRHPVSTDWRQSPPALAALDKADIVVVNGEGTIHHSREKARYLAALGPYCRARGIPCFLVNATLQDNDERLVGDLRAFDHIWVRESASARELAHHGIRHSICADLTFLQPFRRPRAGRGEIIVVDSTRTQLLQALGSLATEAGAPLVSIKYTADASCIGLAPEAVNPAALSAPLSAPYRPMNGFRGYATFLGSFNRMIGGRFHAVCFAVVMRMPFHAIASNTFKIEATLADIGLAPERMLSELDALPALQPYSASELEAIADFLDRTRTAAHRMAGAILQQGRRRLPAPHQLA